MFKILEKKYLAPEIYAFTIKAPRVAKAAKPGQFVIIIIEEDGERIPLTICDSNKDLGTIYLVIQAIGASTKKLIAKKEGEYIKDLLGPLGKPSEFIYEDLNSLKEKKILLAGGGVGVAPLMPQAKWLKENGVKFDIVTGSKSKEFVILEKEFKELADFFFIATDDGSYGFRGMVTDAIKELIINRKREYDLCIIIGPMIMMKFTAKVTKELGLKSIVSMNPIMVDGTGMCGACRVNLDGEIKFACVDGPEFDAHKIDFDEALRRQAQYKDQEQLKDHEYCELVGGMKSGQI
ncbi:MAG: sulfide/dihydroorotate dehydrogenase-like FAD/NAD-binding protein [Tissierellia bacterium]|nr:sulfide/dihydroorotate dehydrogenase-like FAD/NAD-binding protein [Tissierellia bacterium]